ncbi:hypothetical protein GC093_30175 [Paenibacillus sp. LMG 31456]|uniref:SLH domain-containing protein n=1 Tax=Paenibacillus foliorum TaxID=2654974 RepID=A0A972GWL2_9BACL|nr:S-layer homology domain-containing protein [Paenibacillus foliorum]NOU97460.1 hypothetical protein [Paenibacillus foliorum]
MFSYKKLKAIHTMLSFTLLFSLLMPSFALGAESQPQLFSDVNDSYAKTEVQALVNSGILSGYEDGRFKPRQAMTRAEMAKIIVLSLGLKENPKKAVIFMDVAPDSWFRGYVGALAESGITQGTSDNHFSPEETVTREELVVFFIRAMGLEENAKKLTETAKLADINEVSSWAKAHVSLAFQIGFINGIENKDGTLKFSAKEKAERQALARLCYELKSNKAAYIEKAQAMVPLLPPTEAKDTNSTPPVPETPAVSGGGGGSSSRNPNTVATDPTQALLNSGTIHNGNVIVEKSGSYGPANGTTTVNGTLTLNPGLDGEVTLQNITANDLVVKSGSQHTVKLKGIHVQGTLQVDTGQQTSKVRIESLEGTAVASTSLKSQAILEPTAGSLGDIKVDPAAAGQEIELRGTINSGVTLSAPGAKIKLAARQNGEATTIAEMKVLATAEINSEEKASLTNIHIGDSASVSLSGAGSVENVKVAVGTTNASVEINNPNIKHIKLDDSAQLKGDPAKMGQVSIEAGEGIEVLATDNIKTILRIAAIRNAVSAITALPDIRNVTVYSAQLESTILSAFGKATAALALGASENELPSWALLQTAAAQIMSIHTELELARDDLSISFAAGDSESSVRQAMTLPSRINADATVTWESDQAKVIDSKGNVNRPEPGQASQKVQLTATLSNRGISVTKKFALTVQPKSNNLEISNLSIGQYLNETEQSVQSSIADIKLRLVGVRPNSTSDRDVFSIDGAAYRVAVTNAVTNEPIILDHMEPLLSNGVPVMNGIKIVAGSRGSNPMVEAGETYILQLLHAQTNEIAVKTTFQVGIFPTKITLSDNDTTYGGVDGRDFTIGWKPAQWSEAVMQKIFILPDDIPLVTSKQTPVAIFNNNTVNSWTGSALTAADSMGNPLSNRNYKIYVQAVDSAGNTQNSNKDFRPVSEYSLIKNTGFSTSEFSDNTVRMNFATVDFNESISSAQVSEGFGQVTFNSSTYKLGIWTGGTDNKWIPITQIDTWRDTGDSLKLTVNAGKVTKGSTYVVRLFTGESAHPEFVASSSFIMGYLASSLTVADNDTFNPGVDGSDFSITWKPSSWVEAVKQEIYILPRLAGYVNRTKHTPLAVFNDRTTKEWSDPTITKDSTGNSLLATDYTVYVVSVASDGRYYAASKFFTPTSESGPLQIISSDSSLPNRVTVQLSKQAASVSAVTYEVITDGSSYKVGIKQDTTDNWLTLTALTGAIAPNPEYITIGYTLKHPGSYKVILYTGTPGQADFKVAAEGASLSLLSSGGGSGSAGGGGGASNGLPATVTSLVYSTLGSNSVQIYYQVANGRVDSIQTSTDSVHWNTAVVQGILQNSEATLTVLQLSPATPYHIRLQITGNDSVVVYSKPIDFTTRSQ